MEDKTLIDTHEDKTLIDEAKHLIARDWQVEVKPQEGE